MPKRSLRWLVGRAIDLAVWRPSHAAFTRDQLIHLRRNAQAGYTDQDHLIAAAEWLGRAQDATTDGGVSGRYSLSTGWSSSYPETTGYIIPTFIALSRELDPSYRARAERCVKFLLSVQLPSGAFPGGEIAENREQPSVFNTAQILNGLVAWHALTGDTVTERAAMRAGEWMVAQQDPDGAFRKNIYGVETTYTSHASCWLAEAGRHFRQDRWTAAAERHLDWVLTHVDPRTGWIDLAGFRTSDHQARKAVTHTLAYTIWGILYLSQTLGRKDAENVARVSATGVMRRLEISGWLPGEINSDWKAADTESACLTGNAQMALIWLWLAEIDDDARFVNAALKAIDLVSAAQSMRNPDPGIRGGIAGSAPVWGNYIYMALPNWAAKFYIDALFARRRALSRVAERPAADWTIPANVPRDVPSGSAAGHDEIRMVMLSNERSSKVPLMLDRWQRWGIKPSAVVLEETAEPPLASRIRTRVRDDGPADLIKGSLRRFSTPKISDKAGTAVVASEGVVTCCERLGIPIVRVGKLSAGGAVAQVAALRPDLLVHAGAGILRRDVLSVPRLGTLNVHMGILPRYRGMNVTEWARLEGNPVGCSVHLIDVGIDTGDILGVREVDTSSARTIQQLRDLVDETQIEYLGEIVRWILRSGSLPPRRAQSASEGRQYFRMHPDLRAILVQRLTAARSPAA